MHTMPNILLTTKLSPLTVVLKNLDPTPFRNFCTDFVLLAGAVPDSTRAKGGFSASLSSSVLVYLNGLSTYQQGHKRKSAMAVDEWSYTSPCRLHV
jgi:hypothetical protein